MIRVFLRTRSLPHPQAFDLDPQANVVSRDGKSTPVRELALAAPISGVVYGTAFNFKRMLAAFGDALHQPPYKEPPKAPVLYIKTGNTLAAPHDPVVIPRGNDAVRIDATLGIVVGRTASRVSAAAALDHVLGFTVVNDVTLPHDSYYRPPIKQRCRDGFCPVGPWIVDKAHVPNPDALQIRVSIDGVVRYTADTADLVRPVARLIADVTDFVTLREGDVLLAGVPHDGPLARPGQVVRIDIDGIGQLENPIVSAATVSQGESA